MQIQALLIFPILILVACSADTQDQIQPPSTQKTGTAPAVIAPTFTSMPTLTPVIFPEISPSVTPASKPEAIPTEPAVICSPLEIHPLEELPEIIGDPYNPPRPGREERHHGIDFAYYHYQERDSMLGEPVQSIVSGVVAGVMDGQYPYGNMVIIETTEDMFPDQLADRLEIPAGQSLYILYAHLDQAPSVTPGESVVPCQPLGEVGLSGNTDIPHLHIEFRLGPAGSVFESMRFYDTRATVEEMETYVLWRTSGTFQHFDPMLLLGPEVEPTATADGN